MTIHTSDPFATPEGDRSPVRRLRGRLAGAVTLWTAPAPAGLTVSSMLVGDGDPASVLGLVDDESALWAAIGVAGVFAVSPLGDADRQLADRFAGLLPAPGGVFKDGGSWRDTPYGPVLADRGRTWAGCRLVETRPLGWARLVEAVIETVEIGPGHDGPLVHYRGRYRTLSDR